MNKRKFAIEEMAWMRNNRTMEPQTITVSMKDDSRGYEISPKRVPLSVLTSFSSQFKDFLKGSSKEFDPAGVDVCVKEGSFALSADDMREPGLMDDFLLLIDTPDLSGVDIKRREIILKWQALAKSTKGVAFKIAASFTDRVIVVDAASNFRIEEGPPIVNVERYIKGEILDLGGNREANAHVRLDDGQVMIIKTDKEIIKSVKENLVYQYAHLRIRGKYNLDTGELTDPVLVELVEYRPKYSETQFQALTKNGEAAWGDIDDPANWVRRLRGGDA